MHKRSESRNSWYHYESEGFGEEFMIHYRDVYNLWIGYTKIAGTCNYAQRSCVCVIAGENIMPPGTVHKIAQ